MATQSKLQRPVTLGQQCPNDSPVIQRQTQQNNFRDLYDEELQVLVTFAINIL
jgi:hypothetical protein